MRHAVLTAGMLLAAAILATGCSSSDSGGDDPGVPPPPPPPPPPGSGLDARPNNTSCVAPSRNTGNVTISTARAFASLPAFNQPLGLLQAPGDASRWFVVEQDGFVRTFANNAAVSVTSQFVNIDARVDSTCSECGLLGMAFHPQFSSNRQVFLAYTRNNSGLQSVVSRFTSPDGGLTLDPNSEQVLFTLRQPFDNHNGGDIKFSGVDGFLYIALGDGGSGGDPQNNGQAINTTLGKILRINVNAGAPYTIPGDNPFAGGNPPLCDDLGLGAQARSTANCPEVFASGMRNPWRMAFDRANGQLWVADVGQGAWEEVNRVNRGGNYGWRQREGAHCFNPSSGCQTAGLIEPVAEYDHTLGNSITGGYVYRGSAIPGLVGRYVFADFGSGRIWHIANDASPTQAATGALDTNFNISSFGEGNDGELFILSYSNGQIHRIAGSGGGGGPGVATQLSATGCVSAADATQPAGGLIPYAPSAAFWSDGAQKERWIGLPNGQNMTVGGDGDWGFPNGTVLMKSFRLGGTLVETRLFMRHPDGVWAGYSYEWNPQQTDATLVMGGKTVTVGGQQWVFPSDAQCLQCHTDVAGRALGLETRQLAHDITYPQTGRNANQLVTHNAINTLSPPIANPTAQTPYPDPSGAAGTMAERARSYLHTNCSQCHRAGGPTPVSLDLRYSVALSASAACDVAPTAGDLGIANARVIAPGDPDRSVLVARMNVRGANQMPPLASTRVDDAGVTLVRNWIASLQNCN